MNSSNKVTKANSSTNLPADVSATQRLAANKREKQSLLRAIAKIEAEGSLLEKNLELEKQAIIDEKIQMSVKRKARTPGQTMILGRIVWTAHDNDPKFAALFYEILKKYPTRKADRDRLAPHFGLKRSQAAANVDDAEPTGSTKLSVNPVVAGERQTNVAGETDAGAMFGELNADHLGSNFRANMTDATPGHN